MTEFSPPPPAGRRGIVVLVVLALIFFGILALLLIYSRKETPGEASPAAASSMFVIPESIKVRTEASAKAPVVTTVTRGEELKVVEDHGNWVKVSTPDGVEGWAERASLESSTEHERRAGRAATIRRLPTLAGKVEKDTPLYAGPGVFYPVIGKLSRGDEVQIFTRDHDFFAVGQGKDGVAYADVSAIDLSAAGGAQFEVASRSPAIDLPPEEPTISELMPPEISEPEETAPPPPAEPVPDEPSVRPRDGIYPVVPPGGTPPRIVRQVKPQYPVIARRSGIEGPVVLRAIIRSNGSVDDVQILRDLPLGLGDAAKEAVERWKFRPARYRGEPISVYYTVTVNFKLEE